MTSKALDVFVFSYNRGVWLDNLVQSVFEMLSPPLDVEVHIFDDHSDEEQTLQALERLKAKGVNICHATDFDMQGRGSRGGLHAGIEAALMHVARSDSLALLLQDDMQIVRPVSADEIVDLRSFAETIGNPFVYVNFLTGGEKYRKESMQWCDEGYYIKYSRRERRHRAYTDVCAVHVDILRNSDFVFERSEKKIDHQAAKVFGPMAWSPIPFTAMLPDPSVYRAGQHFSGRPLSFNKMDSDTVDNFMNRDFTSELPVAEKYLELVDCDLPTPWTYGAEMQIHNRVLQKLKQIFKTKS